MPLRTDYDISFTTLLEYQRYCIAHANGHDPAGHDPAGHDPAGHDPAGHDPAGHDPAGHDPAGHDPAGHDRTVTSAARERATSKQLK